MLDVRALPLPATTNDISLGFGSGAAQHVYATSEKGTLRFHRWRCTWTKTRASRNGRQRVRAIATSLNHPETAYVSYDHLTLDGKSGSVWRRPRNSGGELATGVEGI